MPSDLVSVVIPTFNKENLIEATLYSVLKQSYPKIEIILVDNGSTDRTKDKIDNFLIQYPGVFTIIDVEENFGPSNARNLGILKARGKYIFLLDGDDILFPGKIEKQVKYMEDNPLVGLSVTPYLIYSPSKRFSVRLVSELDSQKLVMGWLGMSYFGGLVESTGCIRRELLRDDLLFDLTLMGSEGLDFTIKWFNSFPVGVLGEPLTIYRISPNQLHNNVAAISENVTRVTNRYVSSAGQKKKLFLQQISFFQLNDLRFKHKPFLLWYLFKSFVTFNGPGIKMFWWVAIRNIGAVLKGGRYVEAVESLLRSTGARSPN